MRQRDLFDIFTGRFMDSWNHQILYGVLFLLFGVTIIIFPRILAAMVASVFILIGFLLISSVWTFKSMANRSHGFRDEFFDPF